MQNAVLWENIQSFDLDKPNVPVPFSSRLAVEEKWTVEQTLQVITEYKKYIYLCCISENTLTPSKKVDAAWHLHLTYTRNYWESFCENVLKRKLHHNPTIGSAEEINSFQLAYAETLHLYEQEFGLKADPAIWPEPGAIELTSPLISIDERRNHVISHTAFRIALIVTAILTYLMFQLPAAPIVHLIKILTLASLAIGVWYHLTEISRTSPSEGTSNGACGASCGSGCGSGCGGGD